VVDKSPFTMVGCILLDIIYALMLLFVLSALDVDLVVP
jgi:hypothetical protein